MATTKKSLKDKLKDVRASAHVPIGKLSKPQPKPAPAEKEHIPDLREVVSNKSACDQIVNLVETSADLKRDIDVLQKQRDAITDRLKKLVKENDIEKCQVGNFRVTYYNAPRSSLDRDLLLSHNVKPEVLTACTVTKDVWSLKITEGKEEKE